jgi:hypothetical protein
VTRRGAGPVVSFVRTRRTAREHRAERAKAEPRGVPNPDNNAGVSARARHTWGRAQKAQGKGRARA